ncbi:MAG: hypothetical protein K8T20_08495 [Planctomycetes bacterium]|nr:hypothetical protein [Planctomycetota bacterium]
MRRIVVPMLVFAALVMLLVGISRKQPSARPLSPPAPRTSGAASVRIESWPGAEISLDGRRRVRIPYGENEVTVEGVPAGKHLLRVAVPHLQAWVETIDILPGETLTRKVSRFGPPLLSRQFDNPPVAAPTQEYGTLCIATDPPKCRMDCETLDWQETVKTRRWIVVANVPPGTHLIRFTSGNMKQESAVRCSAGQVTRLVLDLMTGLAFEPDAGVFPGSRWEEWSTGKVAYGIPSSSHALTSVLDVATNSDGYRVATCDADSHVWLWEIGTKTRGQIVATDLDAAACVALSPDGGRLAASDFNHRVWVYDVALKRRLATFEEARGGIRGVVFNADGSLVAAADSAGYVHAWAVDARRHLWSRRFGEHTVNDLAVDATGMTLAIAADGEHPVQVCDFRTGEEVRTFGDDKSGAECVALSVNPPLLAAIYANGAAKFWDSQTGEERRLVLLDQLPTHYSLTDSDLSASRDGLFAILGNSTIWIYGPAGAKKPRVSLDQVPGACAIALSADGKRLIVGTADSRITTVELK